MVWGGITAKARTPLVVIDGYWTDSLYHAEILQTHVIPFLQQHHITLQFDNARPHVVTDFLTQQNVDVMLCPVLSSDLFPIEDDSSEVLGTKKLKKQRSRIGGRIHSVPFGDDGETEDPATVELGATWIHGKGPVTELAEAFDLIDYGLTEDEYYGMYVGSNGTKCNEELVRKAKEEFRKIIEELYENKLSASSLTLYPSILEYIQYRLDQVVKTLPDNDRDEFKDICRTLIKVEEENHGSALEDVSVFIPDNIAPGNNTSLTGGYSALISRLAHTVTDRRIHLKTKVINIDYTNPEEVNILYESENGTIMYIADHVIVTISLGVLKKDHQILFNPGLPFEKVASILKLGYGTASKIILRYKTPFWSRSEGMKLVWKKDTIESNTNLPSWAKCLYTVNSMAANPNTLDVWLCGEEGKEIETIPNDIIAPVLTTVFKQFLNDPTIPEPDSILKTSWFSNRQFRGSYSYIRVGSTAEDVRILATPLVAKDNKPVLLFAGEATDIDYLATTHGSLNSGIREANRLLMRQTNTVISHVKPC